MCVCIKERDVRVMKSIVFAVVWACAVFYHGNTDVVPIRQLGLGGWKKSSCLCECECAYTLVCAC